MIQKSDWTLGVIRIRTLVTENYSNARGPLKAAGFFVVTIVHKGTCAFFIPSFPSHLQSFNFLFMHTNMGRGGMELFIYCLSIRVRVWPIRMCLSYRTSLEPKMLNKYLLNTWQMNSEVILDTVTKAVWYYGKHNDSWKNSLKKFQP